MTDDGRSSDRDGKVGYGRPPVEHQFKKGQSGNPNGRPKGSKNFSTDLKAVLAMPVVYEQDGTRKRISSQLAAFLRLREKGIKGEFRPLVHFLGLAERHNGGEPSAETNQVLSTDDQAILDDYVARRRAEIEAAAGPVTRSDGDEEK